MSIEKRTNDRPEEDGTLSSGGPEFISEETIHLHGAARDRRLGGSGGQHRESDQPIVVRDGRADHMAKELAQRHRGYSTHARERITPTSSVSRTLSALREKRLKQGRYRARSVKRQWIPRAGGRKLRPLGIPVLEDKIVQQAVKMILESIWEADFYDESVGYRPGKGARQSSLDLRETLNGGSYRWIVKADIRGFFDHMD